MSSRTRTGSAIRTGEPRLRCAIYTRKSTEEGLDQEFNSLDAQREACAAFVASQAGLGWKLVQERYDDGGISGGTMERPALQRLLQDIRDKRIDVVVVYKIDRLTRSLTDFAKIVEVFDGHAASFVSVTQQFNTTTSMGRLTLNVLLSFAQFEREVTAERIRDKIAASRKKGMWMGGAVPLGYRVQDRKLLISEPEASFVRRLFSRYLELKSVPALAREISLDAAAANGAPASELVCDRYRNRPMYPGVLYQLLANPLYLGKARHKGEIHEGEHEPLIDAEFFEAVQKQLALGAQVPRGTAMRKDTHLLTGVLFDDTGDRMSPIHGKSNGRRYRYYVSRRILKSAEGAPDSWRVSAQEIEKVVREQAVRILQDQKLIAGWIEDYASTDQIRSGLARASNLASALSEPEPADAQRALLAALFESVTLSVSSIRFAVKARAIVGALLGDDLTDPADSKHDTIAIDLPILIRRRRNGMRIVIDSPYAKPEPDPSLVNLIARAQIYLAKLTGPSAMNTTSIAEAFDVDRADVGRILPLAFLGPKMLDAILTGTQPTSLSARHLARTELPVNWLEQDSVFSA